MDFQNTLTPLFIVPGDLLKYFLQAFGFYTIISYFMEILALQFCLSGISAYFENVVFIWLQSYHYYPHLLKNPYYDNVLGAYFSQVFYVSSVAVFIGAFRLRYGWILFFTGLFVGIEYLFLALGIYKSTGGAPRILL